MWFHLIILFLGVIYSSSAQEYKRVMGDIDWNNLSESEKTEKFQEARQQFDRESALEIELIRQIKGINKKQI
jgi:hypothetical protein